MALVVKRKGHKQDFDIKKVYASVYASCRNVHMNEQDAEAMADKVSREIEAQLKNKNEIDSNEIFKLTTEVLKNHNQEASFMYETHRDVS